MGARTAAKEGGFRVAEIPLRETWLPFQNRRNAHLPRCALPSDAGENACVSCKSTSKRSYSSSSLNASAAVASTSLPVVVDIAA